MTTCKPSVFPHSCPSVLRSEMSARKRTLCLTRQEFKSRGTISAVIAERAKSFLVYFYDNWYLLVPHSVSGTEDSE